MKKLKISTWLVIISLVVFLIASIIAMCTAEDTVMHNYCIAVMAYELVFATPLWVWCMFAMQYPDGIYR